MNEGISMVALKCKTEQNSKWGEQKQTAIQTN